VAHLFNGDTADEVWRRAAEEFRASEGVSIQPSRDGDTYEVLHACFTIADPRQRWILSRQPALNPAFAIAEVVWILGGREDSAFVNHWNPLLPKFAGAENTYYGAYGYRLRCNFGMDQLSRAFKILENNPNSRQVNLQIWDATRDLPYENGQPRARDIPCNIASMLKVRNGHLEWTQLMRSNDLQLGMPHNVVQFTSLQEVVAGWLGIPLGHYFQLSDSLHVYERDWKQVNNKTIVVPPLNNDSLMLQKGESDKVWNELAARMAVMVANPVWIVRPWKQTVCWSSAPRAFQNLLRIAAADDARRRGWEDEAAALAQDVSNPLLQAAWGRWASRCEEGKQRLSIRRD
jgi:thymidylate synthase